MVGTWMLCGNGGSLIWTLSWLAHGCSVRGKLKNTACPEVFGMSNKRKCANCRAYRDFSLYPKQFVRARERDDGGKNKHAKLINKRNPKPTKGTKKPPTQTSKQINKQTRGEGNVESSSNNSTAQPSLPRSEVWEGMLSEFGLWASAGRLRFWGLAKNTLSADQPKLVFDEVPQAGGKTPRSMVKPGALLPTPSALRSILPPKTPKCQERAPKS